MTRPASDRGQVLADLETDPDDLVRLRLIAALREVFGQGPESPAERVARRPGSSFPPTSEG
jgi:hypothetical protein